MFYGALNLQVLSYVHFHLIFIQPCEYLKQLTDKEIETQEESLDVLHTFLPLHLLSPMV